jgi:hypothetical protein
MYLRGSLVGSNVCEQEGAKLKIRSAALMPTILLCGLPCFAQQKVTPQSCSEPKLAAPGPGYQKSDIKEQPKDTADLPSVVATVEQALRCYQAMTLETDPLHPKGLSQLSSVVLDFKTVTGKTVGFTFSVFVFKIGGSREKDVTNDISFTYSVPKPAVVGTKSLTHVAPVPLFEQLVTDIQAAAATAQAKSSVLGIPLGKVQITIAYGIKFDGSGGVNIPISLVTFGPNFDYNKNNTQTLTLTFGQ